MKGRPKWECRYRQVYFGALYGILGPLERSENAKYFLINFNLKFWV